MKESLEDMLIRHEGLKLKPYRCTAGKLTIGIGRNLDEVGITDAEARMMLSYDIESRRSELLKFSWFRNLDPVRQDAIIDMSFMGVARLLEFKKMIRYLEKKEYIGAANEMLASKWAGQVGKRAEELALIIATSPIDP